VAEDAGATPAGSGSNVSWIVNAGPEMHCPLLAPELELDPEPPVLVLVELCSVTSSTPSIRRSLSSVRATSGWLVAQPLSVITGTLPGGVAEATAEEALAPALAVALGAAVAPEPPVEPVPLEELDELEELDDDALPDPLLEPTLPSSEVTEASLGSTRPSSWKACAQSKRASTSCDTAFTRSSRSAMKLV
jgi:hypothetical protein